METKEAIFGRRSVRKFTDEIVTDGEIAELLEAARWAPSWANLQAWEFIVVKDREMIQKVTDTYSSTNPARKCSASASVVLVICSKTDVSGFKEGVQRTKFTSWYMFDLGLAVENICLRAHDMGLGTVIVGSMDHDACRALLSLPEGFEVVAAIPVGRPALPPKEGPSRRAIESCAHLNSYGTPFTVKS